MNKPRINHDLVGSLAWGIGILILALGLSLARQRGHVDGDTVTRLVIGANGLMIAWFGNRMPKTFVPAAWARQLRRVAGWSFVLSGLVYAALWALAPMPVAIAGGCAAVLLGIAVTVGYGWVLRGRVKAGRSV